ncbi:MAG: ribonuclease J, partial [Firmicutes bacterium]|nr:ribonuclease J [Bacillota bacterium]
KIAITGRSIINSTRIAMELGYLHVPEGFLVESEELEKLPRGKTAVLMTGSQGEPMSALSRISNCEHRDMEILRGDTVIISASPIPGNEKMVFRTVDNLFKLGAEVFYHQFSGVHVSGHGSEEELKMMINMVRPRYLVPVHGEYRQMMHHAKIAVKVGMPEENVFLVENGTVMEFTRKRVRMLDEVAAGNILVDGLGVGDVGNAVLRDRRILSEDGIVIVTATVENDRLVAGPEIATRGFVYVRESENLLETARNSVLEYFQVIDERKKRRDWLVLKGEICERMSRLFREKTGRRPMIIPVIMEIDKK